MADETKATYFSNPKGPKPSEGVKDAQAPTQSASSMPVARSAFPRAITSSPKARWVNFESSPVKSRGAATTMTQTEEKRGAGKATNTTKRQKTSEGIKGGDYQSFIIILTILGVFIILMLVIINL